MLEKVFSFKWLFTKEEPEPLKSLSIIPRGFLDYETGRRVEFNPKTGEEYFID